MTISRKQQKFINEYLMCWNASEAARRAGYRGKSNVVGPQLLANVSISIEIDRRIKENTLSANEVLCRLSAQARAEYSQYLRPNGMVDLGALLQDGKGYLIKSIKETQYGKNIEFYDSQNALIHLGKHYGLFTDRIEHTWQNQLPEGYKADEVQRQFAELLKQAALKND